MLFAYYECVLDFSTVEDNQRLHCKAVEKTMNTTLKYKIMQASDFPLIHPISHNRDRIGYKNSLSQVFIPVPLTHVYHLKRLDCSRPSVATLIAYRIPLANLFSMVPRNLPTH